MSGPKRRELAAENAVLLNKLEQIHEDLGDFLADSDEDEELDGIDDTEADEDDEEDDGATE